MSGFYVGGSIHDMVQCPYVPSHQVGRSRMHRHLLECRQNHPELAEHIILCNFDSSHHVPKVHYGIHLHLCKAYNLHLYRIASQSQGQGSGGKKEEGSDDDDDESKEPADAETKATNPKPLRPVMQKYVELFGDSDFIGGILKESDKNEKTVTLTIEEEENENKKRLEEFYKLFEDVLGIQNGDKRLGQG